MKTTKKVDLAAIAKRALTAAKKAAFGDGEFVGWCLACGAKANGVEPDARRYTCRKCHAPKVFGAEEIVMMGGGF